MGGSKQHTHRLVMQGPGVFRCVYCGCLFGALSQGAGTRMPDPLAAPRWGSDSDRFSAR